MYSNGHLKALARKHEEWLKNATNEELFAYMEGQVSLSKRNFWNVLNGDLGPQEKHNKWLKWTEQGQPCQYLSPETQDVPYLIPIPIDPE